MNENIKELIKYEYENGKSINQLSKEYNTKVGTIKSWISRGNWIKKKENNATIKKSATIQPLKCNHLQPPATSKEIQIKQDILENKTKEEVMKNNDIGQTTYYKNATSIRKMRLQKTEEYLDNLLDEVYPDLEILLKTLEKTKRNAIILAMKELKENKLENVKEIKKAYDCLKSMGNDLVRTGKMLTHYEILEIESELYKINGETELEAPIFIEDIEE